MSLRIAMLGTCYSPPAIRGGEEAVLHELNTRFTRRGHDVDIYTPAFRRLRGVDDASTAKNVIRLPVPSIPFFYHFEFARKLRRALAGREYDFILNTHHHLGHRLGRSPHVVRVPETSYSGSKWARATGPVTLLEAVTRRTIGRWVERGVYRHSDHIVAVAEHIADQLVRFGVPRDKITVIGNGVDCERFCPASDKGPPDRTARDPVLIYAGRLVHGKNIPLLLDAAAILAARGRRFRVRILGNGPQRRELKRAAARLGLTDRVEFPGRVDADKLPDEHRRSDVFVLPSRYEGMPNAVLEAMACGVPAVLTRFQGAEKIVRSGYNGVVLRRDTPEELAEVLDALLRDPAARNTMGRHARQLMVAEFSWRRIADQYLAMCRDRLGLDC